MDAVLLQAVYEKAFLIKTLDERMRALIDSGVFLGFLYSPRGQEIVAAAMGVCVRDEDYLVTTYRGIHDQLAKGVDPKALLAELFGKRDGTCKGKGGPMHITDPEHGVMVTTGIVGGGIPIACGLGLAAQFDGQGRICVASFGDGATNTGAFHEAVNLAAIWDLPVVFLCQNNEYAEYTPRSTTQRGQIADRAASYGIAAEAVDGNDAPAMVTALSEAVERARLGRGPTLLDCRTYRFMGHFYGEPQAYIDKAELAERMAADPVPRLRATLLAAADVSPQAIADKEQAISEEVEQAIDFAIRSPEPDFSELSTDIYAEATP
jgi:TPP-dependent pyruvate/acetoin dehydrogenase alpha subunit